MDSRKRMTDDELVQLLVSGENPDRAIRSLYRDHFDMLSRYVLKNSGNQQDAEDVFQEVVVNFIALVREQKFRGESGIGTFLYSMNRNTWLNELKRKKRAAARELRFEENRDPVEEDVSEAVVAREARREIIRVMEELGDVCRKILLLFYYEGLTIREILEQLDYENEQVVRNKKYKCLKQLTEKISQDPVLKENLKNLLHG